MTLRSRFSTLDEPDNQRAALSYLDRLDALNAIMAMRRILHDRVALHMGEHVLEIGCGPGTSLHRLCSAQPKIRAIGVDASDSMIRVAKERHCCCNGLDFFVSQAENLVLPSAQFDVVMVERTLMHCSNLAQIGNEVARVLRPQGFLIGCEPDWLSCDILNDNEKYTDQILSSYKKAICNAGMGAMLPSWLDEAGFDCIEKIIFIHDVNHAESTQIFGPQRAVDIAVSGGLSNEAGRAWLDQFHTSQSIIRLPFSIVVGRKR